MSVWVKTLEEHYVCKKVFFWNPATSRCKNGTYLGSIIDDSVVLCDRVIEETKTIPTKFVLTKSTSTNIYNLLPNCQSPKHYW